MALIRGGERYCVMYANIPQEGIMVVSKAQGGPTGETLEKVIGAMVALGMGILRRWRGRLGRWGVIMR